MQLEAISKMFLIAKSKQGAKSAHSPSYVSFLQHSSGGKRCFCSPKYNFEMASKHCTNLTIFDHLH